MSTTPPEDPGAVPPPVTPAAPPPPAAAPPPPPPPPTYAAPPPPTYAPQPPVAGGMPGAPQGVPRPGEVLDRFLARLIDGILLGIVQLIFLLVAGAIFISSAHIDSDGTVHDQSGVFLAHAIFGILGGLVGLGYFAFLESSRGQTIGKQVMKLRVYGPDGTSNPTMEQAVRRNIWNGFPVLYIIPILGPIVAGLGTLAAEIYAAVTINQDTVRREGWHDKFAGGTHVMKIG